MRDSAPESTDWSWNEMLDAFRALGGEARNIVPGTGEFRRGLFPAEPAQPVLLRVPPNLLFRADELEFVDGELRVRDSARVPDPERNFFERYESAFSWDAGAKSESIGFIHGLDALPSEARSTLIEEFDFGDLLEGDSTERSQKRFLRSRELPWTNVSCIAPLIELANHNALGLACEQTETHLEIKGHVRGEVLVSSGDHDAVSMFHTFGCDSREPVAFSLAMQLKLEDIEIIIRRNTHEAVRRGTDWVPLTVLENGKIELSYLMVGHSGFPRLSRGIFRTLLCEAGIQGADEAFDHILRLNTVKITKLLKALEPHRSETISRLRRMARFQLEAMTCCIGSRELEPMAIPGAQTWRPSAR